jgi:hypothetical protein
MGGLWGAHTGYGRATNRAPLPVDAAAITARPIAQRREVAFGVALPI